MGKIKDKISTAIAIIIYMIIGAVYGMIGVKIIDHMVVDSNDMIFNIGCIVLMLIFFYLSIYLHTIIHEAGHYAAGKISGYTLASFRIGSIILINQDTGLKCKRFNIPGTAGQCLMEPPLNSSPRESYPYLLYNLGGILANAITGIISMTIYLLLPDISLLNLFLCIFALMGFMLAATNGIPIMVNGISNDGHNILDLKKSPEARESFWLQLKINGYLSKGVRLKDMPEEWFQLKSGNNVDNPLAWSCVIFKAARYYDQREFEKAYEAYKEIIEKPNGIGKLQEKEIKCELLFLEIIGPNRAEEVNKLYNKELRKYIKATPSYISHQSLMYVYNLLVTHNHEEAARSLKAFEKACSTYPYKGEVEAEREVIEYIRQRQEEI